MFRWLFRSRHDDLLRVIADVLIAQVQGIENMSASTDALTKAVNDLTPQVARVATAVQNLPNSDAVVDAATATVVAATSTLTGILPDPAPVA